MDDTDVTQATTSGFAAIASAFVMEAISHMIPWFIVTCAVILCDLATGLRKSWLMGETIRLSKAVRRTMGKMIVYYSFVVMVCMVSLAAGSEMGIERWACLLVCFIEFCSVMSNIMQPHGYDINIIKLAAALLGRAFGGSKREYEDIIERKGDNRDENHIQQDHTP